MSNKPSLLLTSQTGLTPLPVLFMGVLAISTAALFIRYGQEHASSLVVAAYRLGVAALALLPFALTRYRQEIRQLGVAKLTQLGLVGFLLAMHFATWVTSLEYTTVASSVVLVTTVPLWVALLSPFVVRERLPPAVWIGLVIALAGGMLVAVAEGCGLVDGRLRCTGFAQFINGRAMTGNFLALVGAWFAAGYLLAGRKLRASLSLGAYIFCVYGAGAVFLVVAAVISGDKLTGYPPAAYGWLVALGLIPQLLGHTSLNWALRYVSAAYVSVALLGEPIGAAALAYFFLNETPSFLELVGGLFILGGIYVVSQGEPQSIKQTAAVVSENPTG